MAVGMTHHSEKIQRVFLLALSAGTLGVLGWVDAVAGLEYSLGPFYLVPGVLVAWFMGVRWGIPFAGGAALLRLAIETHGAFSLYPGHHFYWDGTVYLASFTVFAGLTAWVRKLTDRQASLIQELQHTLAEVRELKGMLPICAWCKKVRDDEGYWLQVDTYLHDHTKATLTHGICPECRAKQFPDNEVTP